MKPKLEFIEYNLENKIIGIIAVKSLFQILLFKQLIIIIVY